jgi:hypothetical protein
MSISEQVTTIIERGNTPTEQGRNCVEFAERMREMGLLKQPQDVMTDPHSIGMDKLKRMYASSVNMEKSYSSGY